MSDPTVTVCGDCGQKMSTAVRAGMHGAHYDLFGVLRNCLGAQIVASNGGAK